VRKGIIDVMCRYSVIYKPVLAPIIYFLKTMSVFIFLVGITKLHMVLHEKQYHLRNAGIS
jgi:hypothetical protein